MTELRKPIDYPFLGKNYKSYSDLGRAFANNFESAKREIFTKKFLNYIKSADLFLYGEIKQEIMRTKYADNAVSTVIYKLNPKLGIILYDMQIKNFEEFVKAASSPDLKLRSILLKFLEDHCLSHIFKALEKDDTKTEAFWNMIIEVEDEAKNHDYVLTYLVYVWNYKRDVLSTNSFKELDTYVTLLEEGKGHLFSKFDQIKKETPFLGYIAYEYGFMIANVFDTDSFMSLFDFLNFASKNVKFVFDNFFSKSPVLWVLANYKEYEFVGEPALELKEDIIAFNDKLAIKEQREELDDNEIAIYKEMLKEREVLEASNPFKLSEDIALEDENKTDFNTLKDTSDIDEVNELDSTKELNEEELHDETIDTSKEEKVVLVEKDSSKNADDSLLKEDEENLLTNEKADSEEKSLTKKEEKALKKAAIKEEKALLKQEKILEKQKIAEEKKMKKEADRIDNKSKEILENELEVSKEAFNNDIDNNDIDNSENIETSKNPFENDTEDNLEVPDELINRKAANEQTIEFSTLKEQLKQEELEALEEKERKEEEMKNSRTRITTSIEIIASDFGKEVEIFNEARELYERFINQFIYSSVIKDEISIFAKNRSGIYDLTTPFDKHFFVAKEFLIEEGLTSNEKDISATDKIEITKRNLNTILENTDKILHQTTRDLETSVNFRNQAVLAATNDPVLFNKQKRKSTIITSLILFLIGSLGLFLHVIYTYKSFGNQWNKFFYFIGLDGIKDHSTYFWLRGDSYKDILAFSANLVIILAVFILLAAFIVSLFTNKKPKLYDVETVLNNDLGRNHQGESYVSNRLSSVKEELNSLVFDPEVPVSLPSDYVTSIKTVYERKKACTAAKSLLLEEANNVKSKKQKSHPVVTAVLFAITSTYIAYILSLLYKETTNVINNSFFNDVRNYVIELNSDGTWIYLGLFTYLIFRIFKRKDNALSLVLLTIANAIVIILFVFIKALIK